MASQFQDPATSAGTIDSLTKLEETPQGQRDRWSAEITYAEKELEKFHDRARRTVRRFIDDRDAVEANQKWLNIFNTNVGIMEASLYANIPTADVSRRFFDMNDDVGRVAGSILQRCIQQDMAEPDCDFDQVMRQAVSDRLIPGLGTAWIRLETETEDQPEITDENGGVSVPMDEEGNPLQRITRQDICIDYVFWEDFLWSPCRVWAERRWVARKVPMTRDQLTKRFGDEVGKRINLDYATKGNAAPNNTAPMNTVMKRACIYEIWDIQKREVIWFSKGFDSLLDVKPDPLGLSERFEPCPKPLFANLTTSNCVPKPDYVMLQDQYNELDEVNNRISLLVIACKVVGVYDRSAEGVQRMLTEGYDNILIPVDNWAMFAEKGGIKGQVDWLPLDTVVQSLGQLQGHREAVKGQIYELTGISDIVRGSSKASETLGAQELKAKFASVRIQKLQDETTRFAEDILQIKAELLCKHFEPQILAEMANVANMVPEDQQLVIPALGLLKGPTEKMEWRVTIQSDAMATIDYAQQKTERSEFLNAVATFLQSSSTVGQGAPQLIPLMLQMLKFGVAGFKVGKDIEGVFDRYISEFEQELEAQKQAPPQPDPEQQKMEMEMAMKQKDAALKQQGQQADLQMKQVEQQADMQMQQQEHQMKLSQMAQEFQLKLTQMQQEFALKMEMEQQQAQLKLSVSAATAEQSMEHAEMKAENESEKSDD
jgi:hypothetical protein